MKKIASLLAVLLFGLFITLSAQTQQRKKVAVVLSGGGAKGMAHIGALKVIEEAGIPIDYIAGTSMGAIVGGLYAIGYTTEQMDSMVNHQDWNFLLSDRTKRSEQTLTERQNSETYVLSIPFNKNLKEKALGGIIQGQNLANLFSELTRGYHDSISFDSLPTPFACVSENIVNGNEIVFHSGVLATAMRASMAIPGVFTPVRMDGMVLIDGGMKNNYPANVAKAMGADIIIGVDVQDSLKGADQLNNVSDIFKQILDLATQASYQANIAITNTYIKVNVNGYSAASFNNAAIDTLILRGEAAARSQWDALQELKKAIGIPENFVPKEQKPYTPLPSSDTVSVKSTTFATIEEDKKQSLNLGIRFDSEEIASLLLNATLNIHTRIPSRLSITGRLGMRYAARVDYTLEPIPLRNFTFAYLFEYNDINIYSHGERVYNTNYKYHSGEFSFSDIRYKNFRFVLGTRFEYFKYKNFLYSSPEFDIQVKPEHFFSYFAQLHYSTYNKGYFASKGTDVKASYSLYTDNLAQYKGHAPFSSIAAAWSSVVSVSNRFALIPSAYGRVLIGKEIPYSYLNALGGNVFGRFLPQQLPFAGITNTEMTDNSVIVVSLKLRQRFGSRNYVTLTGNAALAHHHLFDILSGKQIYGGSLGYGYNSLFGPLEASFGYSSRSHGVGVYISLGYNF